MKNTNDEKSIAEESSKQTQKKDEDSGSITFSFTKKTFRYIAAIVALIILSYWGLNNTEKLSSIFSGIMALIEPFIIGFCIAFVINVLMRPIERLWDKLSKKKNSKIAQKLKRPVSLILSALLIFGIAFALLFMVIPEFKNTFETIAKAFPSYITKIEGWLATAVSFAENHGFTLPDFSFNYEKIMDVVGNAINSSGIVDKTLDITGSIVTGIVNLVVALAFSFYLLAQKEKLAAAAKKTLFAFYHKRKVEKFLDFIELTDQTFTNFVSGQLMEAVIIGILCFIGMLIFRMPYAAVISVLVGSTALIPVFGAFIGTAIGAFLILFVSPMKAIWFVVFIVILQQLEGNLIYPKVVGKSVGLPGIWVLAAVTIGGNMLGVAGILISVPACAVLYTLLRQEVYGKLKKKKIIL
ncbi:MAG: AI-2E family transporter [Clostridia bacterium]|nr:AI-2E family transporter [Clostridia bacterium]